MVKHKSWRKVAVLTNVAHFQSAGIRTNKSRDLQGLENFNSLERYLRKRVNVYKKTFQLGICQNTFPECLQNWPQKLPIVLHFTRN